MTIDERLENLAQTVELILGMMRDNEKRQRQNSRRMGQLLAVVRKHEDRLNWLETLEDSDEGGEPNGMKGAGSKPAILVMAENCKKRSIDERIGRPDAERGIALQHASGQREAHGRADQGSRRLREVAGAAHQASQQT